ncbi:MAG TPA: hypothetical protein PLA90_15270 [Candidatus Sumerlaeota bacterium]|nr:hypothetical protein [Candidatus Sumerlaeota bacterium]
MNEDLKFQVRADMEQLRLLSIRHYTGSIIAAVLTCVALVYLLKNLHTLNSESDLNLNHICRGFLIVVINIGVLTSLLLALTG